MGSAVSEAKWGLHLNCLLFGATKIFRNQETISQRDDSPVVVRIRDAILFSMYYSSRDIQSVTAILPLNVP
jgi:hypothetical protein